MAACELKIPKERRDRILEKWDHWHKGFDCQQALKELLDAGYTQLNIANLIGDGGQSQISKMLRGREPRHRAGEAIYILYVESFGKKPA